MDDVLDILKLGREKESQRQAAYEDAARAASNPLAVNTFSALAKEEQKHARYLEAYYQKQVANEGWPPPAEMGVEDVGLAETVKQVIAAANAQIKDVALRHEDLTDVYNAAMAAERESIQLYSDGLDKATDPNAKAFFTILVKAERWHLELLSNSQEYLDDTSMWNFEEEQWIVEG